MAWVSSKYSITKIVEYSTILIIEVGFGENTITERKKDQWSEDKVDWQPDYINKRNKNQRIIWISVVKALAKFQLFPSISGTGEI